ncbi:hypothetical protein LWM50_005021, partial [Salmonella enterica]|nr:hypothetical protein [Salmonella enterica]
MWMRGYLGGWLCFIGLLSFSSYADAQAIVTPFQSEVSGILRQKLDDLRVSTAVAVATMEAFSETSVSYAAALATEYGTTLASMSWGSVAYGLGLPSLSVVVGSGIGVFTAKVMLHKNGYDLVFPEPAMSPASSTGYWWGVYRAPSEKTVYTVVATNPWSAVNNLYSFVKTENRCALLPDGISYSSSVASFGYFVVCPGHYDPDVLTYEPESVTANFSLKYPVVSGQPLYCDRGQVAVAADGVFKCQAAAEGSFFSPMHGYGINGGHLAKGSLAAVINGVVGQMSSSSLSDYKGVPPD